MDHPINNGEGTGPSLIVIYDSLHNPHCIARHANHGCVVRSMRHSFRHEIATHSEISF